MRRRLLLSFLLMVAVVVARPDFVGATPPAPVEVSVGRIGVITEGGSAVVVPVRVRCQPGWHPLESNLFVSQEGGASTDDLGVLPVVCDGKPRRALVRAATFDGTFVPGEAFASAFALVVDDPDFEGETFSASESHQIRLRPGRRPGG